MSVIDGFKNMDGSYNGAKLLSFMASIPEEKVKEIFRFVQSLQSKGLSQEEIREEIRKKYSI